MFIIRSSLFSAKDTQELNIIIEMLEIQLPLVLEETDYKHKKEIEKHNNIKRKREDDEGQHKNSGKSIEEINEATTIILDTDIDNMVEENSYYAGKLKLCRKEDEKNLSRTLQEYIEFRGQSNITLRSFHNDIIFQGGEDIIDGLLENLQLCEQIKTIFQQSSDKDSNPNFGIFRFRNKICSKDEEYKEVHFDKMDEELHIVLAQHVEKSNGPLLNINLMDEVSEN